MFCFVGLGDKSKSVSSRTPMKQNFHVGQEGQEDGSVESGPSIVTTGRRNCLNRAHLTPPALSSAEEKLVKYHGIVNARSLIEIYTHDNNDGYWSSFLVGLPLPCLALTSGQPERTFGTAHQREHQHGTSIPRTNRRVGDIDIHCYA